MKIDGPAIAKKASKWFKGTFTDSVFTAECEVSDIKDVEDHSDYISLKDYIKYSGTNWSKTFEKDVLRKLKLTVVFIRDNIHDGLNAEGRLTAKAWNTLFFGNKNPKCQKCVNKCKQSSRVDMHTCPQYKPKPKVVKK